MKFRVGDIYKRGEDHPFWIERRIIVEVIEQYGVYARVKITDQNIWGEEKTTETYAWPDWFKAKNLVLDKQLTIDRQMKQVIS